MRPPNQTRKALGTFPCPSKQGTAVLAGDTCYTEAVGTSAFADTPPWMYLPIQDAVAPGENNNLRCLLLQAQLLHTYLGWLNSSNNSGRVLLWCLWFPVGSAKADSCQLYLSVLSGVLDNSPQSHSRPMPCLELQSKMKSGAAFCFPQENCLLQMVLSFSLYPV